MGDPQKPWVSMRKWSNVGWVGGTPHLGHLHLWEEIYNLLILTSRSFSYLWTNWASFVSGVSNGLTGLTLYSCDLIWTYLQYIVKDASRDVILGRKPFSISDLTNLDPFPGDVFRARSLDPQVPNPNFRNFLAFQAMFKDLKTTIICRLSYPQQETERWLPLGPWNLGAGKGSSWDWRFAPWSTGQCGRSGTGRCG